MNAASDRRMWSCVPRQQWPMQASAALWAIFFCGGNALHSHSATAASLPVLLAFGVECWREARPKNMTRQDVAGIVPYMCIIPMAPISASSSSAGWSRSRRSKFPFGKTPRFRRPLWHQDEIIHWLARAARKGPWTRLSSSIASWNEAGSRARRNMRAFLHRLRMAAEMRARQRSKNG